MTINNSTNWTRYTVGPASIDYMFSPSPTRIEPRERIISLQVGKLNVTGYASTDPNHFGENAKYAIFGSVVSQGEPSRRKIRANEEAIRETIEALKTTDIDPHAKALTATVLNTLVSKL